MTRLDEPTAGRLSGIVRAAGLALAIVAGSIAGIGAGAESIAKTGRATGTMRIGTTTLVLELPVGPEAVQKGLSDRDAVSPGTDGMLFRAEGQPAFGMGGMRICLDFVWIAGDAVVGVTEDICPAPTGSPPEDSPVVVPPAPITAAVETPAGWVANHGIAAEDGVSPLVVAPRTVNRMVAKAVRNGRFVPTEIDTIGRTLLDAGIEPARIVSRMERAGADGTVSKREVRRIIRQVRTHFAEVRPRDGSPDSHGVAGTGSFD